jgi:hypothetical protein
MTFLHSPAQNCERNKSRSARTHALSNKEFQVEQMISDIRRSDISDLSANYTTTGGRKKVGERERATISFIDCEFTYFVWLSDNSKYRTQLVPLILGSLLLTVSVSLLFFLSSDIFL